MITCGWLVAALGTATGKASLLSHTRLIGGGVALWRALPLFIAGWQVMIAAMMLPSALPMARFHEIVLLDQDPVGPELGALLAGYTLLWGAFGAIAFMGDVGLHRLVDSTPLLAEHPWLVAAGALGLAGGYQLSRLKGRCLDRCRNPTMSRKERSWGGPTAAFRIGCREGASCLGCNWALMLLMFAAGVSDLALMATLGGLMYYEKAGRHGLGTTRLSGALLLGWATLMVAHPWWLPRVLSGLNG